MLVHVNGACSPGIRITAGGIVPCRSRARCEPNVKSVEEHAVRIVRIHDDSLVVPVLRIITGTIWAATVSQRAALRTFHEGPACAAVSSSPGADLATRSFAAAAVAVTDNRLGLGIDVIRVTRRHSNVDTAQLIARININKRRAAAGIHGRSSRVRTAADCIAEDETISVACN